ncbi:MAG: glucosaminidase domain-containing protein [Treponema sp.]|jgi:hypothetical protein|nr:glucosaminidase domain-containing protein [Treponema sp.]
MKFFYLFLPIALFLSVFSCVSVQPEKPVPEQTIPDAVDVPSEKPGLGINIMGKGRVDEEKLSLFLVQNSLLAKPDYARILAGLYIEESAHEGIDHDVAFAQMCLETGFLSFGGLVQPEWNNFCGLGAIGPEQPGLVFPDPRTGVRAHIQHLKAYATAEPLNLALVDPRYRYVRLGSSPTIKGLAGTWAADRMYSEKIYGILQRLYEFV